MNEEIARLEDALLSVDR